MATASAIDLSSLEQDPRLFLYTSLTAGSSHIITATSRMETILKANKIPFQAIDIATDEKARRLWQRRAGKKKLPGLVKEGYVLGDLEEIEEWNEFGELKENIGPVPAGNAAPPAGGQTGFNMAPSIATTPTATSGTASVTRPGSGGVSKAPPPLVDDSKIRPFPGSAAAASTEKEDEKATTSVIDDAPKPETITSAPASKEQSISEARAVSGAATITSGPASAENETAASVALADDRPESSGSESDDEEEAEDGESAEDEDDREDEGPAEGIKGLRVGEGAKTQEQSAADGDEAGKSVED